MFKHRSAGLLDDAVATVTMGAILLATDGAAAAVVSDGLTGVLGDCTATGLLKVLSATLAVERSVTALTPLTCKL